MADEARSDIERLNAALEGQPYKLAVVPITSLELLQKNARFMKNEQFRNLVDNIKRDGGLSSVPLCWKHADKYRVLSGNHRVMAAKEAGLGEVLVLYTDRPLTHQEQVAIQLSHNAIAGQDDPTLLKELWAEIEDVGLKYYSGLDDKTLGQLTKAALDALGEAKLDYRLISFMFLPSEEKRLMAAFQAALREASKTVYLQRFKEADRTLDALAAAQSAYNVRNTATALMLVLDVFERHMTDLAAGWEHEEPKASRMVPLASILGTDKVSAEAGATIKRAVEKMRDSGQITRAELWKALEKWAADYQGKK